MEPRPVLQHTTPAYPTRREFLAAGAAGLAAAGISGCGRDAEVSLEVAPVFAHGEGRGATGCIVLAPPVFLSEEEALQVIREELARVGIKLDEGMSLPEVTVEYEDPYAIQMRSGDNWLGEPVPIVSFPADLAAVDRRQRVGVAMVTQDDCHRFHDEFTFSSVSAFDTKGVAQAIADALHKQAKQDLCIGVFYDPLEKRDFSRDHNAAREKSRASSPSGQDFLAWLQKSKGAGLFVVFFGHRSDSLTATWTHG